MRGIQPTPEISIEQARVNVRDNLRVTVVAVGVKGEQIVTHDESGLSDHNLPAALASIVLDSAWLMRQVLGGQDPVNRCFVLFDFGKPPLLDLSNPSDSPTPNASNFRVVAANSTWAAGVREVVETTLDANRLQRQWLHKPHTYDLLLFLGGIPLSLWGTWRVNGAWVHGTSLEPNGLGVLLLVYVFLALLMAFRALFSVSRWLWPFVEFQRNGKKVEEGLRYAFWAVVLGVAATFLYDAIRVLIWGHR
jgi:hypothetical protein